MLPRVRVSTSPRPLFDSASCNISSSEWHVGCDGDGGDDADDNNNGSGGRS